MTTTSSIRRAAVASSAVLALFAGATVAQGEPKPKAFEAVLTTQEVLTPNPVACPVSLLQGTTTGSGRAGHLGNVTMTSNDCVTLGAAQFTFTDGKFILTASNGDTITADYSGALLPTAEFPVYALSGTYRVSGGTGRFSQATGSGFLTGSNNVVTGRGSYVARGTLTY